jgi:hypothetical protein
VGRKIVQIVSKREVTWFGGLVKGISRDIKRNEKNVKKITTGN